MPQELTVEKSPTFRQRALNIYSPKDFIYSAESPEYVWKKKHVSDKKRRMTEETYKRDLYL